MIDSSALGEIREAPTLMDGKDPDIDGMREKLALDEAEENLHGKRQDRREREKYAGKIYNLLRFWIGSLFLILMLQGCYGHPNGGISLWVGKFLFLGGSFSLQEPVLLAFIGGTTASVISVFAIVVAYLFPKRDKSEKP